MADANPHSTAPFGVHSEVGQLRKVMVCAPGLAHTVLQGANAVLAIEDEQF